MPHPLRTRVLGAAACGLAGCGGAGSGTPTAPPDDRAAGRTVALATAPTRSDETVLRAGASPQELGPVRLEGRTRVRFEQYAPEDPRTDFTTQTPYVARLVPVGGGRTLDLFETARPTGSRVVRATGRFRVVLEFGDFPSVVRVTPLGG